MWQGDAVMTDDDSCDDITQPSTSYSVIRTAQSVITRCSCWLSWSSHPLCLLTNRVVVSRQLHCLLFWNRIFLNILNHRYAFIHLTFGNITVNICNLDNGGNYATTNMEPWVWLGYFKWKSKSSWRDKVPYNILTCNYLSV